MTLTQKQMKQLQSVLDSLNLAYRFPENRDYFLTRGREELASFLAINRKAAKPAPLSERLAEGSVRAWEAKHGPTPQKGK